MNIVQKFYQRSEGFDPPLDYTATLGRLRCTSNEKPDLDLVDSKLLSCSFAKKREHGHILAATCEKGQVIILNTKLLGSESSSYSITGVHSNAVFSSVWSEIDMKLVTTSGDLAVGLWKVRDDAKLRKIGSFRGHRRSVKTACFKPQNSDIFATGGRDGNVYIWDSRDRSFKPEQSILNSHSKMYPQNKYGRACVTWITFQDELKLISCADGDTNINVWDLRKTYLRTIEKPIPFYQLPSPRKNSWKGYSHMVINKSATKLYANSFHNVVYNFNVSTYPAYLDRSFEGHQVTCCYDKIDLSPDERYLAGIDNSDSNMYIWRTSSAGMPLLMIDEELPGLSGVSWCTEDELKIATSSDHPAPWIWTIPATKKESQRTPCMIPFQPLSNACDWASSTKNEKKPPIKCVRLRFSAASSVAFRELMKHRVMSPMITLPAYQTHVCVQAPKFQDLKCNWLTNIHNRQSKKLVIKKPAKKAARKTNSASTPACNLLTKYLKKSNETSDTADGAVEHSWTRDWNGRKSASVNY